MFKIGDLAYLRPVPLHDKGVCYDYDYDIAVLRNTHYYTGTLVRENLRWFADGYVDWCTEYLLHKPVIIVDANRFGTGYQGYQVAPPGYVPNITWNICTPWWTGLGSLTHEAPVVQITRRLTVRSNNVR